MLFGRSSELAVGAGAVEQALAGRGSVLVLSGEPGIGKSALSRAIAEAAEARGARVAVGRAWEVGGAPALWPWTQALTDLGLELDALLGSASGEAAAAQRVVAFDRVTRALTALAGDRLLVVVLEDLHAADTASLELGLAFARGIARQRVLLLATTRESELLDSAEHAELVAKIAREGRRLLLGRLDGSAVAEWLAAAGFDGDAAAVSRLTEGNPLFVEEAVRVGVARFTDAAAGGVAVVLRQHVERASEATRRVLSAAAVLGREAPRADVVALSGATPDEVAAAEREGLRVGILAKSGRDALVFSHVLLRDALYELLDAPARAERHARAFAVLEARGESEAMTVLHALAGTSVLGPGAVMASVERAAQAALDRHAGDAAMSLVDGARARLAGRLDDASALSLDLLVADVRMRQGAATEARALAVACAARAAALGRPEERARAALIYGAELMSGERDETMVQLLGDALAGLPEGAVRLRARVMTRFAAALIPPDSDDVFRAAQAHAKEGVALARQTGDPATLLYALRFAAGALGYAVNMDARETLVRELMALALAQRDDVTLANVGAFAVAQLYESGRPDDAVAEAERYCERVERLPLPQLRWRAAALRASMAALAGRFEESALHGDELHRRAAEAQAPHGLLAWALHQLSLTVCDGNVARLAANEAAVLAIVRRAPPLTPWVALAHALFGRAAEARVALRPVVEKPRGFPWLLTAGQVTVLLADAELAAVFYPLLQNERFRSRFFWGPAGVFPVGPTSRVLGELAMLLGREDEARTFLDEAVAQCRDCAAASLLVLAERALARLGGPAPHAAPAAKPTTVALTREGDVWLVAAHGRAPFRVKHTKGLDYLSALVAAPGREQYVLALAGAGEGPEDAGVLLDERAKAQYRARVEDLEDQRAEAERNGDAARAARARAELDAIAEQLAGALGLGGRDRKAASNVERARINVQRRIKDALRRVAEHDAELARYLEATVRTGTYCVYEPV